MPSQTTPRLFALLIGVDLYLSDGTRKTDDGTPISMGNLGGCVNDVEALQTFLADRFQPYQVQTLTSTPSADANSPLEPDHDRPTFDNIKHRVDRITADAQPSDVFFFHFSGHGLRLPPTAHSPADGRAGDPSLITLDYACGHPAVRGWQLNAWLKRLHDKRVQTLVSLDSCYAGGSWRHDELIRTPAHLSPPATLPNLPADEAAGADEHVAVGTRHAALDVSWGINPSGFTLLAACTATETAAETNVDGVRYGAYTHALLRYLDEIGPRIVTYRVLRDQLARRIARQTPQVHGRDRLGFLGTKEPFGVTPSVFEMAGDRVVLPVGAFHGVRKGARFTTAPASAVVLAIEWVDDVRSGLTLPPELVPTMRRFDAVVPCQWSLGSDTLTVLVDPEVGGAFPALLASCLGAKIAGQIDVRSCAGGDATMADFQVHSRGGDGLDISTAMPLIGLNGRAWSLDGRNQSADARAEDSARSIAHLLRFGQILNLRHDASPAPAPFTAALEPAPGTGPFTDGQTVRFTIHSATPDRVHFAVVILSLGFHVKQLYPARDASAPLLPGGTRSFAFKTSVPEAMRARPGVRDRVVWRDTVRVVVTRGEVPSLKSMELPDIWDVDPSSVRDPDPVGRPGRYLPESAGLSWWVDDIPMDIAVPDTPLPDG